jgi:glycosyltransferase involved in cell wall biosynthesis
MVHTLELVRALAARDRLRLRIVLPPRPDSEVLAALRGVGDLELRTYDEVVNSGIETDIVHRPYQVFTEHDLRLLQRLGRRIVVTQQDHLLYRTPSYFASHAEWEDYRQVSRIALAWADRAVFFTDHARREALRDGLLDPAQAQVVPVGADHASAAGVRRRPAGLPDFEGRPFLLTLGSDLAHKNRPFAIRLLHALHLDHGWDGALVLAGPQAKHGSSRAEESRMLSDGSQPVVVLERVDDAERRWLLEECAAVVFPSTDEGFGLVPFEAAAAGKPCLFASLGALAETLPPSAALLVPWDARRSAVNSLEVLAPGPRREHHVEELLAASLRFRWADVAADLERLYEDVLASAPRPVARIVAAEVEHQRAYEAFRTRTGEEGMALLGPGGLLPAKMLRPLLAVCSRPALRRPFFALLRAAYRAGHRSAG